MDFETSIDAYVSGIDRSLAMMNAATAQSKISEAIGKAAGLNGAVMAGMNTLPNVPAPSFWHDAVAQNGFLRAAELGGAALATMGNLPNVPGLPLWQDAEIRNGFLRAAELSGAALAATNGLSNLPLPALLQGAEFNSGFLRAAELSGVAGRLSELWSRLDSFEIPSQERRIWLPGDEEITEENFNSLVVPSSQMPVALGTIQLAAMRALIRDPRLLDRLDPRQFELVVAELLASQGYKDVILTPRSNDGGKDIIAVRESSIVYVECKHYPNGRVKIVDVRALLGTVYSDRVHKGVLVTSGRLTRGGVAFVAKNAKKLAFKDSDDLFEWLAEYKKFMH